MVLGLRSKTRKCTTIHVDYVVHVQEIKPWPPSQSLKSLRSVVLQWDNAGGDRNSGSTDPVVPSTDDGKIEFNKSFNLHVTMYKEAGSGKKNESGGSFLKNVLELNLYEPRNNKSAKGQHIGSAAFDLAELGVIEEEVNVSVPVSCKRSFRNTSQPVMYLSLCPSEKDGSVSSSSKGSGNLSSQAASLDRDERESVSTLMTEEYAEEAEIASFTDDEDDGDDRQSRPSLGNSTSSFYTNASSSNGESDDQSLLKNVSEISEVKRVEDAGNINQLTSMNETADLKHATEAYNTEDFNSHPKEESHLILPEKSPNSESLNDASSSMSASVISHSNESSIKEDRPPSNSSMNGLTMVSQASCNDVTYSSSQAITCHDSKQITLNASTNAKDHLQVEESFEDCNSHSTEDFDHPVDIPIVCHEGPSDPTPARANQENGFPESEKVIQTADEEESIKEIQNHSVEIKTLSDSNPGGVSSASVPSVDLLPTLSRQRVPTNPVSDSSVLSRRTLGGRSGISSNGSSSELEDLKSVRSLVIYNHFKEDATEIDIVEDVPSSAEQLMDGAEACEQKYAGVTLDMKPDSQADNNISDKKIQQLESRVEMLEAELRDIAAIEVSLYSMVAEHGGSAQKVHAPARRLSRLYNYALENWSTARSSSTARTVVSGLVLAAKACGNDVPRLTFWLSNLVVLRTVAAQAIERLGSTLSAKVSIHNTIANKTSDNGNLVIPDLKPYPLKWKPSKGEKNFVTAESGSCNWKEPQTFIGSLEKIESWIFSRIIKSLWWQTLTPYMQTSNVEEQKSFHKKGGRFLRLSSYQRTDSSTDHWKKAFKEARERLCPVRAAGLECGCLSSIAQLVMEQCVARLDVAMFNAILRASDDEIPTDPVSDPISDSNVIPISAAELSFGAGAQLKNVIGNWSRWLTDLFGIDDEQLEDVDGENFAASGKSFCLLNALSDLLMLPKDLLSERSIRKEVCPTFSGLIIKRILSCFVTDEFCPDPVPHDVFQVLDDEDENGGSEAIQDLPCSVPPIAYTPLPAASVARLIGLAASTRGRPIQRSESCVLRKCYTSDDELDELESPLDSFVLDKSRLPSPANLMEKKGSSPVRYKLLREVWMDD